MVASALAALALLGTSYAMPNAPKGGNHGQQPTKCETSTFSIQTASTANPTASGVSIDNDSGYIVYSTVPEFLQDLNTTVASTFDYTNANFGLLNNTYPSTGKNDKGKTQWQLFDQYLRWLNQHSGDSVQYKLLFIGRHGTGYHNQEQTYVGTPSWDCFTAEETGNGTITWADAHLTASGIAQALVANAYWTELMETQKITPPESFYVSPLYRCLQTANYTFANLRLPQSNPYRPKIKELFRESISIHTCDRRSDKSVIAAAFPGYAFDSDFTETDELWNGVTAETSSAQAYRSLVILDSIFTTDTNQIISVTTHSGETASLLSVLGHQAFALGTGQVIPVLVKAEYVHRKPSPTTTVPWTTGAWCTNGPPLSTATDGSCVCSNGVTPTAIAPSLVFTSTSTSAATVTA